jgi:hypothetical protein
LRRAMYGSAVRRGSDAIEHQPLTELLLPYISTGAEPGREFEFDEVHSFLSTTVAIW